MNFVSYAFLFLFLVAFAVRLLPLSKRAYLWTLIVISTVFYGWERPAYVFVIYGIIVFDYVVGLAIRSELAKTAQERWHIAWLSVAANALLLIYFKYKIFFMTSARSVLSYFGVPLSTPGGAGSVASDPKSDLPLGISFHTFQSIAYNLDVAKYVHDPVLKLRDFMFTVMFFPQLVAGPIVRPREFLYQLTRKRSLRWKPFSEGLYLLAKGFFLKCALGDNFGAFVDQNWDKLSLGAGTSAAWIVCIAFGLQIFCDFEGYSTIARGLAYIFGFKFPKNFNYPYLASTFRNFWERWHMTLSRWFRDYVYIPIGGNRGGRLFTCRNLLITMLIAGLWHGASWTFVIWGLLHGLLLCGERLAGMHRDNKSWLTASVWRVIVGVGILYTWVWFRAVDVQDALAISRQLLGLGIHVTDGVLAATAEKSLVVATPAGLWLLVGVMLLIHGYAALQEHRIVGPMRPMGKALLTGVLTFLAISWHDVTSGFIYFQF